MRDIVIKNLTSQDKHRRTLHILEKINQNGFFATAERYRSYVLREKQHFNNLEEINHWLISNESQPMTKLRYLNVTKRKDTASNEENLTYEMVGRSYLIAGYSIFCVFFTHIFKIQISKPQTATSS